MREQTFERHPLDSHVLLSQNIADIQRVDGISFKAGIIKDAAGEELTDNLISLPSTFKFFAKTFPKFSSADDAPVELKAHLSQASLDKLASMTQHFEIAAGDNNIGLSIARDLGKVFPITRGLHFEGRNPYGPSLERTITGNLSVTKTGKRQLRWLPTENLTEDEIRAIVNPTVQEKPKHTLEHTLSGTFAAFWGPDLQKNNLHNHGWAHAGPLELHPRTTVLWGVFKKAYH